MTPPLWCPLGPRARSTSDARECAELPGEAWYIQVAMPRVSSGLAGMARRAPLPLPLSPPPAWVLLPSRRIAVALALAEPGPALALVQLMQVSRGLTWRTLALAPPGGAWVTTVSWGLLLGAAGPA